MAAPKNKYIIGEVLMYRSGSQTSGTARVVDVRGNGSISVLFEDGSPPYPLTFPKPNELFTKTETEFQLFVRDTLRRSDLGLDEIEERWNNNGRQ